MQRPLRDRRVLQKSENGTRSRTEERRTNNWIIFSCRKRPTPRVSFSVFSKIAPKPLISPQNLPISHQNLPISHQNRFLPDIHVGSISYRYPNYITYSIFNYHLCLIRHYRLLLMPHRALLVLTYALYGIFNYQLCLIRHKQLFLKYHLCRMRH